MMMMSRVKERYSQFINQEKRRKEKKRASEAGMNELKDEDAKARVDFKLFLTQEME